MRERTLLILVTCVCLFGFGAVAVWLKIPRPSGVTIENFRRLQFDMTEERVSEIFGRPPDFKEQVTSGAAAYWYNPVVAFQIFLDSTGRVTSGETIWTNPALHEVESLEESRWTLFGRQRVLD